MLKIREVDTDDDEIVDVIHWLDRQCFPQEGRGDPEQGWWWLVFHTDPYTTPIAYAGMVKSRSTPNGVYFNRCGVLPAFRGQGLQKKLIRVRQCKAKRLGFTTVVSDTNEAASANNLIACGFRMFSPKLRWGLASSTYWRKSLCQT